MTAYRGYRPPRRSVLLRLLVVSVVLLAIVLYFIIANPFSEKTAKTQIVREQIYQGGRSVDAVDLVAASWRMEPGSSTGVEISLSFSGTDADGILVPIQSIPSLNVYRYPSPERLAVVIPALSDWLPLNEMNLAGQSLVDSVYCFNNTIYMQMRAPVSVSLEGVGGSLVLHLQQKAPQQVQAGYVALIDAITSYEYSEALNKLESIGMSPAMCSDGRTILVQSQIMRSESAALSIATQAEEICASLGLKAKARTVDAKSDTPPDAAEMISARDRSRTWGGMNARLVMRDAKIIAQAYTSPELLVMRSDGAIELLNESGARIPIRGGKKGNVTHASISANAAYIAYATVDGALNVLDNSKGVSRALAFPITPYTTTFAWIGANNLYTMSGKPMRLYSIAVDDAFFTADDTSETETAIAADPFDGSEGELVAVADSVFFREASSMVYKIDLAAQTRVSVGMAQRFSVAPSGTAVMLMSGDENGAALTWHTMAPPSQSIVGMGMPVISFCVDASGTRAYILQRERNAARLYSCDANSAELKQLSQMPTGELYASRQPGNIIVNCQEADGSWSVYMVTI